ncbi:hypothetical protein EUTSA_v10021728mg [Eutrema salsugineum]|uniref:Uncharacterized protein n=1 Tax=Eutrema salsugineum TaxID=72664 RepID=V4LYU5_EUTSA|nr:hypothetical protein EUTSA_v10021728mg [Eutrema salsugineum]
MSLYTEEKKRSISSRFMIISQVDTKSFLLHDLIIRAAVADGFDGGGRGFRGGGGGESTTEGILCSWDVGVLQLRPSSSSPSLLFLEFLDRILIVAGKLNLDRSCNNSRSISIIPCVFCLFGESFFFFVDVENLLEKVRG